MAVQNDVNLVFFVLGIDLTIHILLFFPYNFLHCFCGSVKNIIGFQIGIVMNLCIVFDSVTFPQNYVNLGGRKMSPGSYQIYFLFVS